MSRPIHLTRDAGGNGFAIVQPLTARQRRAQREYAERAMSLAYRTIPTATDAELLLAEWNKSQRSACAPPSRVKIDRSVGGSQPQAIAPLVRDPRRQASSINSVWTPVHYHKFFCAHDRFRGLPCTACKRTTRDGRAFLATV